MDSKKIIELREHLLHNDSSTLKNDTKIEKDIMNEELLSIAFKISKESIPLSFVESANTNYLNSYGLWYKYNCEEIIGQKKKMISGHAQLIYCLSYSPDGKKLISTSDDRTLKIWSTETGEELVNFEGNWFPSQCAAWHPEGKIIATGHGDNRIRIWDAKIGAEIRITPKHYSQVCSIKWMPDGKTLVSSSWDKSAMMWNSETGEHLKSFWGHDGSVYNADVTKDGKYIVTSGGEDLSVRIWEVETKEMLRKLEGHSMSVNHAGLSPDDSKIVSIGEDEKVIVWDFKSGEMIKELKEHKTWVWCGAWAPNGKLYASGDGNGEVIVWNTEDWSVAYRFIAHLNRRVYSIAWSPDSAEIATGSTDCTIAYWREGKLVRRIESHWSPITCLDGVQNGKILATGGEDNLIKIWDKESNQNVKTLEGHEAELTSLYMLKSEKQLVSTSKDKTIRLWDFENFSELKKFEGAKDEIKSIIFSPDEKQFASSDGNNILIWDFDSATIISTLESHNDTIWELDWSSDSLSLVSAGYDKQLIIWDAQKFEKKKVLEHPTDHFYCVAFSKDSKKIVSGGTDMMLRVWDTEKAELEKEFAGHSGSVCSVKWSPDQRLIFSGSSDKKVYIWSYELGLELKRISNNLDSIYQLKIIGDDLVTVGKDMRIIFYGLNLGESDEILEKHQDKITFLVWSPDEKHFVSGSIDEYVTVWDATNFEKKTELSTKSNFVYKSASWSSDSSKIAVSANSDIEIFLFIFDSRSGELLKILEGHSDSIFSVDWSKNGEKIATGSNDKKIIIWDGNNFEIKRFCLGHSKAVNQVAWCPESKLLASASIDTSVKIWDTEKGVPLKSFQHENEVISVCWAPNKNYLAASDYNIIKIWNINVEEFYYLEGHQSYINCIQFSEDGKTIFSADYYSSKLWNCETFSEILTIPTFLKNYIRFFNMCNRDFTKILISINDNNILIKNLNNISSFMNLHLIIKELKNIKNTEKLFEKFPLKRINTLFFENPYNKVYPYGYTIFHLLSSDPENLSKLIKLCLKYNFFPSVAYCEDFFKKSALYYSLVSKNRSSTELLLDFYTKKNSKLSKQPLGMRFAFNKEIIHKILDLDYSFMLSRVLDCRFVEPFINLNDELEFSWNLDEDFYTMTLDSEVVQKKTFEIVFKEEDKNTKIFNILEKGIEILKGFIFGSAEKEKDLVKIDVRILDIQDLMEVPPLGENSFIEKVSELPSDHEIYKNNVFSYIIDYKWKTYARSNFLHDSIRYIILLILITFNSVFIMPNRLEQSNGLKCRNSFFSYCYISLVVNAINFIILIWFFIKEIFQIKELTWRTYSNSFWNKLDLILIILGISLSVVEILEIFGKVTDLDLLKILHCLSVFFVWLRMLNIFRGFDETSFMVRTLLQVSIDIRSFLIILVFFMLTFCFTYYVIQDTYDTGKWKSFQIFYLVALGDFGGLENIHTSLKLLFWILFLISSAIMPIVLINLLIAIISESFANILNTQKQANNYEKTHLILECEKGLSDKDRKEVNLNNKKFFCVIYKRSVEEFEEFESEKKVEDKINDLEEKFERKFEMQEKKLEVFFNKIMEKLENK